VSRGLFRPDLYYRINVVPVFIPPLRERREDIPLLVDHFLRRYAPGRTVSLLPEALHSLVTYPWPGNVRELRNVIQRIALFAADTISVDELPQELRDHGPIDMFVKACDRCFSEERMTFDQVVACLEVNLLNKALREAGGNRTKAAQLLSLSQSTFRDKLKKYNLNGSE
jgi:DNA-binding NtrC family response regulator